jgi:hypothetical protein
MEPLRHDVRSAEAAGAAGVAYGVDWTVGRGGRNEDEA